MERKLCVCYSMNEQLSVGDAKLGPLGGWLPYTLRNTASRARAGRMRRKNANR